MPAYNGKRDAQPSQIIILVEQWKTNNPASPMNIDLFLIKPRMCHMAISVQFMWSHTQQLAIAHWIVWSMPWEHQGSLLLTGKGFALNDWPSARAWPLPSWGKVLNKNAGAQDFTQANLYLSFTLTLCILIPTFKSAVQVVSDMDISKIAFGLLSAGGRAAPCLTLHSSSWCFHSFLTQRNTGSGSKQQELSVAQEEQLCLIHSSRFSIKFGSEGTHFILLLLHWVIHLHLHSFPVDVQRLVVHHSLLKCHWDISYLCLQEAGRANQGSSAHTTGTVASWTLTPSSGNS